MPTVSVTKPSANLTFGGMFQPSQRVIELAVDYCGETTPSSLQDVIDGLERNQNWAIAVGRPLGQPPTGIGTYNQFEIGTPADQTSAETTDRPFVVQSYTGRLDPGSNNVWRISIVLSLLVRNITDDGDFPGRNHSAVSITSQSRSVRAYRIGKMVPYDATGPNAGELMTPEMSWNGTNGRFDNTWITCQGTDDDIEGDGVDINGEPLSMPIEQTSITLSFVIREPYYATYSDLSRTTNAMWTKWGKNPSQHLNKRNTTTLFGYDVGRLVVTAVNVTPIDMEFRRVDITLVDDEWYHFDQMPWSFAGTVPELAANCDDPTPGVDLVVWNNKYVFWITPIVEGFDWVATDFPDDVWSFFTSAVTIS